MNCRFMGIYIHTPGGQNRHIGILSFDSQGLDYTYNDAYIHTYTYTENKIELDLLKIDQHKRQNETRVE